MTTSLTTVEGVGIVVAVGDEVKDPQIGDVVGLKWLNGACGSCEMCLLGHESNCPSATFSGYTVDGSFQQYAIGKAQHVARLPKDADLAAAAPISKQSGSQFLKRISLTEQCVLVSLSTRP